VRREFGSEEEVVGYVSGRGLRMPRSEPCDAVCYLVFKITVVSEDRTVWLVVTDDGARS